jgi:aspartyl-tRNA(Asn)/glutamyl-tRNA(Gln) amidotransferase subunit A
MMAVRDGGEDEMDLEQALAAYAAWQGYGHASRARAWIDRLEVNRPELDAFRAAPVPEAPAYRALPVVPEASRGITAPRPAARVSAGVALEAAREAAALNAFTFIPQDLAPAARGFLDGAAVAIKDLMAVQGWPLTGGGKAMGMTRPSADAPVVARIRRAGGSIVALTNLHEFAYGITSDNPHFGRVVNPAAPDRIPGGSSGGSAAAVAAGIVRHAVGTDTAGSIRIPAACCGIVGFKPSYDALPRDGVLDLAASLDHVGPMTRTVDECAELFAAMLGLDTVPAWVRPDLAGTTVGVLGGYFAEPLDPEVRTALDQAVQALALEGARIAPAQVDGIELAAAIQLQTIAPEATAVHIDRLRTKGEAFGEDVRVRLETGLFFPGAWYAKAQRMRTPLVHAIESAFGEARVLLCPTLRVPAPRVGAARIELGARSLSLHAAITNLTMPFNLSGLPAISVPWSSSRDGVPLSLQIVGRRGHDWEVLAFARRLEAAAPWQQPHLRLSRT